MMRALLRPTPTTEYRQQTASKPEGEITQQRRLLRNAVRSLAKKWCKSGTTNCPPSPASDEFDASIWKAFAEPFSAAQQQHCGWCESPLHTSIPHLDHIYPKAGCQMLHVNTTRQETSALGNMESQRKKGATSFPVMGVAWGFWWLAYKWENWILSCERCNSAWKGDLLPMRRRKDEAPEVLLLNPFVHRKLYQRFCYQKAGVIRAASKDSHARMTIRYLGLSRPTLAKWRAPHWQGVYELCEEWLLWEKGIRSLRATAREEHSQWKGMQSEIEQKLRKEVSGEGDCPGMARSLVCEKLGESVLLRLLPDDDPELTPTSDAVQTSFAQTLHED